MGFAIFFIVRVFSVHISCSDGFLQYSSYIEMFLFILNFVHLNIKNIKLRSLKLVFQNISFSHCQDGYIRPKCGTLSLFTVSIHTEQEQGLGFTSHT